MQERESIHWRDLLMGKWQGRPNKKILYARATWIILVFLIVIAGIPVVTACPTPHVTGITPNTGSRGTSGSYTISGSDFLTAAGTSVTVQITKSGSSAIDATVVSKTGTQIICTISIPPGAATGTWNVKVTNNEGSSHVSGTGSNLFTVTNQPPELDPIGPKSVNEGNTLTITASALDPNGDPLTYSASPLPAGAEFNAGTKKFTWTPGFNQAGSYPVTFTVSDGTLTDTEVVTITVNNVNRAPVLNPIGDKTVDEHAPLTFTVTATDPDIPADTLTFSLAGAPTGAIINPSSGSFTWTPGFDQAGSYTLTVEVSDGHGGSDSKTASITVNNVNRAPVLNPIGDKTVDEHAPLTFTATATDPDIPADTLTFSLVGAPTGATINPSSGAFTWTPGFDQAGSHPVTFTISDGSLIDTEEITITVRNVNRAPELTPIGAQSTDEGVQLEFTITATDPDGDTLTYSASTLPDGASFDTGTRTFTWTPGFDQAGSHPVTFKVSDGSLIDTEEITITVRNVNRAPELTPIGAQSTDEGVQLEFTITATDPDIPANTLTYSLDGAPTEATISSSGIFTWTPGFDQAGSHPVTFKVSDGTLIDTEVVTITVNNVNRPPVLNPIEPQTIDEGLELQFTVTASDPDGDILTYSSPDMPAGAALDATTGIFAWTPGYDQAGQYTVTFTVSDGKLADFEDVAINVINFNLPPELDPVGPKSVNEGEELLITLSASDPDGDPLTYSTGTLPTGATFDPGTKTFTWTPGFDQAGLYSVTFSVSDGSNPNTEDVTITVNNINRVPSADFQGIPTLGVAPLTVQFTDMTSNTPTSSKWAYKNATVGWTLFATSNNPSQDFAAGTYDINLTSENADGTDDEIKTSYITATPAEIYFTADKTTGIAPLDVSFKDLSTILPPITSYNWEFGDGETSTEQNPSHEFDNGIYTVALTVTNASGSTERVEPAYIQAFHSHHELFFDTPGLFITGTNTISFDKAQFPGSSEIIGHDLILTYPEGSPFTKLTIHFVDTLDPASNPITGTVTSAILESDIYEGSKYSIKINLKSPPPPGPVITVNTIEHADSATRQKFHDAAAASGMTLLDTSYLLLITTIIDPSYINSGEITVWVSRSWADSYGSGTVRVMRIDSAGSTSLLSTQCTGYDSLDYTCTATSPNGFSTFGVTAVQTPAPPPAAYSGGSGDSGNGGSDSDTGGGGGTGGTAGTTGTTGSGTGGTAGTTGNQATETHDLTVAGLDITTNTITGQQDFSLPSQISGAIVTIAEDKSSVTIAQTGFTITLTADNIAENNGVITGQNVNIDLVTTPQDATFTDLGTVSTSIEAGLSSLPEGATITTTISDQVSPGAQSAFQVAALDAGLGVPTVAYTMSVIKEVIGTTLPATITMTIPSSWVADHGGVGAIQIMRIGDDGNPEVLLTNFIGEQVENGIMTFTGYSTKGLSIFGMVSAKATAIKLQEEPAATIQPITNPAMFTDIGMFSWLLAILTANPILLVIIIAFIALALYFGVLRYRI
jgi:PKD repeat protein